ncbi:MAG: acyl-CoA dehydrogenase family protein, partial [Deltaproteobacteria bacterium]|nr:acyl-CoA dehydrogenase family protein [Deltaproteobacteria bacterium]
RGDPNIGVAAFAAAELCAQALLAGSGQAKSGFLAPMLRGEKVPAIAVTEPHCGTDAVAMRAKAVRKGERYFLRGEKSGITLAKAADFFVVFAKTDPAAGAAGVSAFVVPGDSPGLTRQFYEDMGSKALCRRSIFAKTTWRSRKRTGCG